MEKLVDVHAHLDDEQFEGEVAEIVSRAKANGVERIITNGTNVSSSKRAVKIAESFDEVFCAVGIHPEDIDGFCMDDHIILSHKNMTTWFSSQLTMPAST